MKLKQQSTYFYIIQIISKCEKWITNNNFEGNGKVRKD